jgi:hypothetical protein
MDIIYTIKSIYNTYKFSNISNIFSEPIHIIDKLFIGNIYISANYAILRDYKFKYIINLSDKPNYFEENITYITNNIIFKNNQILNIDDFIILINKIFELLTIEDYNSEFKSNILIYSNDESSFIINLIIILILYLKYNVNIQKTVNLMKKNNKNFNIDIQYIYSIIKLL